MRKIFTVDWARRCLCVSQCRKQNQPSTFFNPLPPKKAAGKQADLMRLTNKQLTATRPQAKNLMFGLEERR
jgi:hypothetical protein